jgi:hypothetical protein
VRPTAIPKRLRSKPQWVAWTREDVDGEPTKRPYIAGPTRTRRAKTTDPRTWRSFEEAKQSLDWADGVGFVVSADDPYIGLDFDHCFVDGELHPYVQWVIEQLDSYTEVSPSGGGLRVMVRAQLNGKKNRTGDTAWGGNFEVYDWGRYFTITGNRFDGTGAAIGEHQPELDEVVRLIFADAQVLKRAKANDKFRRLFWEGDISDYGGDDSGADLALCNLLAWQTQDRDQIRRLWMSSAHTRARPDPEKLKRQDYVAGTIEEALSGDDVPSSDGSSWAPVDLRAALAGGSSEPPPTLLQRTDDVCLLYRGKLHLVYGEPEVGKGWLALYAVAQCLLAGERVMYIDFEADELQIVSRLRELGVPAKTILRRFTYVRPYEALTDDAWGALEGVLDPVPGLVVVDGVTEALTYQGLDLEGNTHTARWFALLPRRLALLGAAVIVIDHVVKDKEKRGRYAIGAQQKLAGADVGLSLEMQESLGRGREGSVRLLVTKDRPGHVRPHGQSVKPNVDWIADMVVSSRKGRVEIELRPPHERLRLGADPNHRVVRALAALMVQGPYPTNLRTLRTHLKGMANAEKGAAIRSAVSEGYVAVEKVKGKSLHSLTEKGLRWIEEQEAEQ